MKSLIFAITVLASVSVLAAPTPKVCTITESPYSEVVKTGTVVAAVCTESGDSNVFVVESGYVGLENAKNLGAARTNISQYLVDRGYRPSGANLFIK